MIERAYGLARWLLHTTLPPELREALLGDLEAEMIERRGAGATELQVLRWAILQALGSLPAALRLRVNPRRTPVHPAPRTRQGAFMQNVVQDIRYAIRLIRGNPLVSGAAIATLAVGIGSSTTIFSVVHATMMRRLPFPEADRIVHIYETFRDNELSRGVVNPSNFDYWERHASAFSDIAAMRSTSATLTGAGEATRVRVQSVTPAFFGAIGVSPAIGRRIAAEDAAGAAPPVLVSHEVWTTRFGANPAITSRTVTLNGVARPIVGVMPPGFGFPNETDLWEGLDLPAELRTNARSWFLGVVARLKPGITIGQANAEIDTLAGQLQSLHPARQKDRGAIVVALADDLIARFADGLVLLQAAVLLVLLIAVANVANLLLALGTERQREINIRFAVGAGRWRIVRQLLTESLMIGLTGALAGGVLAVWGVRTLVALSPLELPPGMQPAVDGPVLAFALTAGVLTSVVFGLAPALLISRANTARTLKDGAPVKIAGGSRAARVRAALVVAEVALAVVLLAGAGLLIRSFTRVISQEIGFEAERILTAQTTLPALRYDTPEKRLQFWNAVLERLEAMSGVQAVGASTAVPFSMWEWQTSFRIVGREDIPNDGTSIRVVNPGYFAALGIPVLKGRTFDPRDTDASELVAVVNAAFARAYLTELEPVGLRLRVGRGDAARTVTIVGVTGDTRHVRLEMAPRPELYEPLAQRPQQTIVLAIRTAGDPRGAASLVKSAIRDLDRDLPVEQLTTLESLIDRTFAERRFYMALMTVFSVLAVLLAMVGVYGVMAFLVGRRTREIGIRMALGAAPEQVQRMVVRSGGLLILTGVAIGGIGALLSMQVLESALFGITPRDPGTMLAVMLLLAAAAAPATYLPARRAGRVDPAVAIRSE